ncbi:MAG: ABC transporter ATP-binding protein [Trueperaceae bacterium]|nr:ABC transporter ATP-binding protein [Trueperaceae bacterium]
MIPANPTPEALLEVRDLRRSFGALQAVRGVSFTVARGETYGLLGPNGAGKTTTISMVAGILRRDGGAVVLDGEPVAATSVAARRSIGLVPQDLAIYPDLNARENLAFFGRLYGLGGKELARRCDAVLDTVGLLDRAGQLVREYSGGMKRRLNIAAGLLHEPKLLILDEPTVGVDPQSRNAILETIELLADGGLAVLYTTHYMEEAERLCDRIGIVDDGRLVAEGTRAELVRLVGGEDDVRVSATGNLAAAAERVRGVEGVSRADVADEGLRLAAKGASGLLTQLVHALDAPGVNVTGIEVREPDLEAVFLSLTGKALRD